MDRGKRTWSPEKRAALLVPIPDQDEPKDGNSEEFELSVESESGESHSQEHKGNATFEAALDGLCLNLSGNKLPLKFSSGVSSLASTGAVNVLVSAREDCTPSVDPSSKVDEDAAKFSVKVKGDWDNESVDSHKPSQADWIKRYVEQQEEWILTTMPATRKSNSIGEIIEF